MTNSEVKRILVAGDTCPINRNLNHFCAGEHTALLGEFQGEFDAADFVVANLECPLIERESPTLKIGPNLSAPVESVRGIKAMGIDAVCLANNHIMDHGAEGLASTIGALQENGIAYTGAGCDLNEARQILSIDVGGARVGIVALAEHEFGIAEMGVPGANPLDEKAFVRHVTAKKKEYEYIVVLVHGGNEHYLYPRPGLQDTCRFLVEQGASAVICQHSHCVGCVEIYRDAPIVYGQGNFLFDMPSPHPTWNTGAFVALEFSDRGPMTHRLIPFYQSASGPGLSPIPQAATEELLSGIEARSSELTSSDRLNARWSSFCKSQRRKYLHNIHGKPGYLRRLAGKMDLLHILDSPARQRARINMICCESHREALVHILNVEANKIDDGV